MDVASTKFNETLKADFLPNGLLFHVKYPSGREFPSPLRCSVSWGEWDYFVAWVELQRKAENLNKTKKETS